MKVQPRRLYLVLQRSSFRHPDETLAILYCNQIHSIGKGETELGHALVITSLAIPSHYSQIRLDRL
jgi:hypothetical protein